MNWHLAEILALIPHCELSLGHNEHHGSYEKIEAYLDHMDIDADEWVSEDQHSKAIETDSLWHLQVYPDTPVGFYRLFAADLDALLYELVKRAGGVTW